MKCSARYRVDYHEEKVEIFTAPQMMNPNYFTHRVKYLNIFWMT